MARSCPWLRSPVRHLLNIWLRNSTKLSNILGKYHLVAVSYSDLSLFSVFCWWMDVLWQSMTWVSIVHLQCNNNERQEMWDVIWCNVVALEINSIACALVCPLSRENILVLDIFFEALNYEKIEQKKAYEIAGLLGKILAVSGSLWQKNVVDLGISTLSGAPAAHFTSCVHAWCLRFPLWTFETGWTHFHNLMLLQGQPGWVWWGVGGWMDTSDNSAQITLRDTELEVTAQGMVSHTIVQLLYLSISVNLSFSRWHWRSDGAVYRSQCFNNTGNIWLPIWGKVMFFTI